MKQFLAVAALTFALVAIAAVPKAQAQNCQDLLANNRYRCQVKTELGSQFEACLQFSSPGSLSSKFDMITEGPEFQTTLECECKAKSDFNNPKFNQSIEFLCGNEQYGDAAEGKAGGHGKRITNGQYFFNSTPDLSYIFQCTLDATCQIH
ncbi:MAG: hypothetical protein HY268_25900 [Deltaproteobacteria bacterium]|nr:hypothetical protein [Deltaproteobacteria bacterium]